MTTPAITFEHVSKKFRLEQSRSRSFQEMLLGLFRRQKSPSTTASLFWGLKDVSFTVFPGEMFSIIGPNGAGKSTLLKLLTSIVKPTTGTITINGRISALLELGTGFHPDLTGRENIYLSGAMVGLSRTEVAKNTAEIIDFAGIGQFIDVPVRHYSSGMFVRLGFALATHLDPDILILDEVLAVGDDSFQKKCIKKIRETRRQGTTIIFVSHSMSIVNSISSRVMWLNNGQVQQIGPPEAVIQAYLAAERGPQGEDTPESPPPPDKVVEIQGVEFINEAGQPVSHLETGQKAAIRINYLAHRPVKNPVFGLAIHKNGTQINGPNTETAGFKIECLQGAGAVDYQIDFLPLLGGTYSLTVGIFDDTHTITYDARVDNIYFTVTQEITREIYGLVHIPARWRHISK